MNKRLKLFFIVTFGLGIQTSFGSSHETDSLTSEHTVSLATSFPGAVSNIEAAAPMDQLQTKLEGLSLIAAEYPACLSTLEKENTTVNIDAPLTNSTDTQEQPSVIQTTQKQLTILRYPFGSLTGEKARREYVTLYNEQRKTFPAKTQYMSYEDTEQLLDIPPELLNLAKKAIGTPMGEWFINVDGKISGIYDICTIDNEGYCEISISLLPDVQGKGLGTEIYQQMFIQAIDKIIDQEIPFMVLEEGAPIIQKKIFQGVKGKIGLKNFSSLIAYVRSCDITTETIQFDHGQLRFWHPTNKLLEETETDQKLRAILLSLINKEERQNAKDQIDTLMSAQS